MIKSNFVLAGIETMRSYWDRLMENKDGSFDNHFNIDQFRDCASSIFTGGLHSFGQNFTGRKKYDKYISNEVNLFEKVKELYGQSIDLIVDSGGFQISIGRLKKNETELLIELYHEFLTNHHQCIDRAFVLDLPPGPGCKLFNTFEDIYDYNLRTYTLAKNLPKEARDKMIYIHHFRSPKLWEIYTKILDSEDMFNSFQNFATGGIIANQSSDAAIPCIIYVLPLIPILRRFVENKRTTLNFHILGGANFRDILFYEIFKKLVQEKHGVELTITYDSSGIFKGLMRGRFLLIFENNKVHKISLKSDSLHLRVNGTTKTMQQMYFDAIDEMTDFHNFKKLSLNAVYENNNTFTSTLRMNSAILILHTFAKIQTYLRTKAIELYELYNNKNYEEFNKEIELVTRNLNYGKISRKQKAKSYSVLNSLKMLENIDEKYCHHLVNKHLAKDEFIDLDVKSRILTV